MTREEIIQAIIDDKMMPFIQPKQLADIVDFVIKNYKSSLPSNLDDAELKYVEFSDYTPANQEEELMVYNAFKAGAKWMAEQCYYIPVEIDNSRTDGRTILSGNFFHFNTGDKVIVQIRRTE